MESSVCGFYRQSKNKVNSSAAGLKFILNENASVATLLGAHTVVSSLAAGMRLCCATFLVFTNQLSSRNRNAGAVGWWLKP